MKKLVFFTVLAMLATTACWGLVVVDEPFSYPLGEIPGQGGWSTAWVDGSPTDPETILDYDGSALPDAGSTWTLYEGGYGVVECTVSNGILRVNDTSTVGGTKIKWNHEVSIDSAAGTTVIVRAKCNSYTGTPENVYVSDGHRTAILSILSDKVMVLDLDISNPGSGASQGDTASNAHPLDGAAWHTYHMTMKNGRVNVYVDYGTKPVISGTATHPAYGTDMVIFGQGVSGATQDIEFDSVHVHTGGAFGPLGMPTSQDTVVVSPLEAAVWGVTGSDGGFQTFKKDFPVNWKRGAANLYASIRLDGEGFDGNFCYLLMNDGTTPTPNETTRIYIRTDRIYLLGKDAQGNLWQPTLVDNPDPETFYHIKLEVDIDGKKYNAYVGDGDRSGENEGHWTKMAENLYWYYPSTGLSSVTWQMYNYGHCFPSDAKVYLDDLFIEGPDNWIPYITLPEANCGGVYDQYRYFTLTPTFEWDVDPHSQIRVKVFTKAQHDAPSFDPELSTAVWDRTEDTTGNTLTYSGPTLLASNMANPPDNIYYVYAKARLDATNSWGAWSEGVDFVCRSSVNQPFAPVISSPSGPLTSGTPPVVAWSVPSGDWDQSRIIITKVGAPTPYYDSGWTNWLSPVDLATVTPALPNLAEGTYQATVQVRKGCSTGEYENAGNSSFTLYDGLPATPIITSPVGPYVGLQPVVTFVNPQGAEDKSHTGVEVKITTDAAGNTAVWAPAVIQTSLFGANCPNILNPGTTYYAFVRLHNPNGGGNWSSYSSFQVSRNGETVSVRHMDEPGIIDGTRVPFPNDLFVGGIPQGFADTDVTVTSPTVCPGGIVRFFDNGEGGVLRRHGVPLDLNKGVTFVTAMRAVIPDGEADLSSELWKSASLLVTDTELKAGAAVKVRNGWYDNNGVYEPATEVSICVNGTSWSTPATIATPPTDFNIIRITGKAATFGVPSSVTWNVYVNEALALTATDAIKQADLEAGTGSWVTGQIAIGQGSFNLKGIFEYDWTAVNCSGAYGPGEWDQAIGAYVPGGGTRDWKLSNSYSSVADALAGETGYVTISGGNVVINHVTDDAYFIQDVDPNAFSLKVDASINETNKGKKLTSVGGLLSSDGVIKRIKSPNTSIGSINLASSPVVMSMKALGGSPCITQLGGISVNNVGKLVRVFGTLPVDPMYDDPMYPTIQIFYVDDMSGMDWVADGREGYPGIRFLIDLSKQSPVSFVEGDVLEIVGISSTETFLDGDTLKTVRKIESPIITKVGP